MSNFRDAHKVYELAAVFRERVIEQGRSFLWPDQEIWTVENAEKLLRIESDLFANHQDMSLLDTSVEVGKQEQYLLMMAADSQAVCHFFWSSSRSTLLKHMNSFLGQQELPKVDQETWDRLTEQATFEVPASWTTYKQTSLSWHLAAISTLTALCRTREESRDVATLESTLLQQETSGVWYHHVWSIAHVLFPEQIAPLPAEDPRRLVLRKFGPNAGVDSGDGEFVQLWKIRELLKTRTGEDFFDFYHPSLFLDWETRKDSIRKWIQYERGGPIPEDVRERADRLLDGGEELPPGPPEHTPNPDPTPPTINDLADATFLAPDFLGEIESLLESRKQLIFEGPPGSGKTFVAEKFARYFTGQSLTEKRDETIELVQFHQSYTYEDFMEGIRPETDAGQLHYNVKPGIFRRFAERAAKNPDQNFVMIIDEINRGNVSRILGELMLLLEYRNETATLPYSQEPFEIPENLFIIGTMNSADRSLSQIDYALRRRFYFLRFLAVEGDDAPVLRGWLRQQEMEEETRRRILKTFIQLNHQLRVHLETDDMQVGHSYFMHPEIHNEQFRTNVWKYAVIPLIREYLYHHRDRDELLIGYEYEAMRAIVQPIADDTQSSADELAQGSSGEAEIQ